MEQDNTHSNRADIATRFQPGQSGNPGGKPYNARNHLKTRFLKALAEDFDKNGEKAIEDMRTYKPAEYVKAIVALMPKELEITRPLDELNDEQLTAALIAVRAVLAAQNTRTGSESESESKQTEVV